MRLTTTWLGCLALLIVSPLNAETIVSTWSSVSSTSAIGELDGVTIFATTSGTSSFSGPVTGRFDAGADWGAGFPLGEDAEALVAGDVNGLDGQLFQFASPISNARLYIENFDSSSSALVSVNGTAPLLLSLASGSSSISFAPAGVEGMGILTTSNANSDGEGDAILEFGGDVTSISLAFTEGTGSNGVFYAFTVEAVPEPSAALSGMVGLAMVLSLRRRRTAAHAV